MTKKRRKAILIDAVNKTVSEVYTTEYTDIYKHLDNDNSPFTVACTLPNGDAVFVDDEGLLKSDLDAGFVLEPYNRPLIGNGLIMGCDEEGETDHCKTNLKDVKVWFLEKWQAQEWRNLQLSMPVQIFSWK